MKMEIFKTEGGKFRFRLKANNGQIILTSQNYANKAGAKNGAESVAKNAGIADRYERKESKDGKPFFNLLAANKQVVGTSQRYASKDSLEKGVKAVMKAADGVDIVEVEG